MRTELKWLLAGAAALVLQAAAATEVEARNGPVFKERHAPAHKTRHVPVRHECATPDLSPKTWARCHLIARQAKLCLRRDLSDDIQRWCDRKRFADVPHFNLVRLARNGAVRSIHLIVTETGQEVFTAYPYGIAFAVPDKRDREVRMRIDALEAFLAGRPTPAATEAPASPSYATGLPIGWNNSTGVASGQCLNYTISTPSNQTERAAFTSQDTANSTAEQIKVSATVKGTFDAFSASDTFSYSDLWQSSSNSSNQYYNLFSIYNLNSTVSATDPLNTQGDNAGDSFDTLCGSQYMASVPAGMVATISINYGSSSETTQTNISNSFEGSFGLDSVSTAVSTASSDQSSSFYFTFTMVSYGGGTGASNDLNAAFAAENASGEAYYALCAQGNSEACTQFTSSMGSGATKALDSFNTLVEGLSGASAPDLSFLETFPNGVAGASTTGLTTLDIPTATSADVLGPFKSVLEPYVGLLNQIGTLRNRVSSLNQLLDRTPAFNPTALLDLVSYLDELENVYEADRAALLANLETCLAATTLNASSVCAEIEGTTSTTAFEWYAAGGENPDFRAQQNTLALQYTGLDGATPLDVIYIDELPPFTAAGSSIPIAGEAAFVGFQDRPPPVGNPAAYVDILALEPGAPLSTDNVSSKVRNDPSAPSPFTLWNINDFAGLELRSIANSFFTSNACTPTFAEPCAIDYSVGSSGVQDVQNVQIEDLF